MPRHHRTDRRVTRRFAAAIAGLVVASGLVATTSVTAVALDSPSALRASEAAIPVLAWERVPGAASYDVQVSRTADFTTIVASATTVNHRYVPQVELPAGETWWRVRATIGTDRSEWATAPFSPERRSAPQPVRPMPGATFTPPEAPRFTWEPVAGATAYTVQTSTDPAFTDPRLVTERTQKTTAAYLTSYPEVGTHYWRVRAELGTGYSTAWTVPQQYGIRALPDVQRTSPDDVFDKDVTASTFATDVVLDWEPLPGAATYDLRIDTDRNFLSVDHAESGITGTRYSPPEGLPNDDLYWEVRPVNASGRAGAWQQTPWRFTRAWPAQPEKVYPVGANDPGVPFFYEWDPIERADGYRVRLYDSGGALVCTSAETMHTTLRACIPSAAGEYQWRVEGVDSVDRAGRRIDVPTVLADQPMSRFTYTPPARAGVGLARDARVTGEAASTSGVAAYGLGGAAQDSCADVVPDQCDDLRQTPVLTWDPVPGATSYQVVFTNDAAGTNPYDAVGPDGRVKVDGPMWTPTEAFHDSQAGSAYYWRVLPCDATGCINDAARPQHAFAKVSFAPEQLTPDEGQIVADDVTLRWGSLRDRLDDTGDLDGDGIDEAKPDLDTPAEHDAREYVVQTSTTASEAGLIETDVVEQTTFTSFATTYPEGPVHWRVAAYVRGIEDDAEQTAWSPWRSFVKRSPEPTLVAPEDDAALGQDYTFSWEPLAFAKAYDIEVYAGPTKVDSARTVHSSWAPSNPLPVSEDGYTWRVRRVDAKERVGEWSEVRSFEVGGFPPSLVAPAAGDVVPPSGALFSWQADDRATSYRFERRKPGSVSDLAETVVTRATAWAPTRAVAAGTAQWRVTALDAVGNPLGSSPWRDVAVVDPPREATPVTISGSGKVGTDLRLSAPSFDPAVESTSYQWYRASTPGGTASAIAGATGESYVLTGTDLGRYVTVRATGRLSGYQDATSTSNAIVGVEGDAPVATAPPEITGVSKFGETLGVRPGQWPGSPTLRYQWFRDGVAINGATASTRRLTATDVGRSLHVVETATSPGLPPASSPSAPVVPEPGDAPTAQSPVLTPDPAVVGDTLSVSSVTWVPSGSYSYSYSWFRDGEVIEGARSRTYRLVAEDGDHAVHAMVTASVDGHLDGTTTTAPVEVRQQPVLQNLTRPSISGTASVGESLRADPGTWDAVSPSFRFQWFRDGVALGSPSTSSSYRLGSADAGRSLHVVVTGSASGYRSETSASLPVDVDRVRSTTELTLSTTRTTPTKRVTATVRVSATGIADPGGTVQILDGKRRIGTVRLDGNGSGKLRLPRLKTGRHTVRAVYSGGTQVGSSADKVGLVVAKGRK